MPGQVTHFYHAGRLAEQFPTKASDNDVRGIIHNGFEEWLKANNTLEEDLINANSKGRSSLANKAVNNYRNKLVTSDEIAIFSAFAAGTVGPDIWTCPNSIVELMLTLIKTGGVNGQWYFDLGHYNRSHAFPKYTLDKIKMDFSDFDSLHEEQYKIKLMQKKYQMAYVLGYISHISLDILVHLMVNVFAGAYHKQQKDVWQTEQLGIIELKNVWNNHNKIEHYLDAFIKYFCFEDELPKELVPNHRITNKNLYSKYKNFNEIAKNKFKHNRRWNFPNFQNLYNNTLKFGLIFKTDELIGHNDTLLDLSTSLAGPFAHRYYVKNEKIRVIPFVRDYFWKAYGNTDTDEERNNKDRKEIADWLGENKFKSLHKKSVEDEAMKFRYFNIIDEVDFDGLKDKVDSQYYYLHTVIPNLERVLRNTDEFYSPGAFGEFILGSIDIAKSFINKAVDYINGKKDNLDFLNFWNLDTGLRYKIKKGSANKTKDVLATIDIENVFDLDELKSWHFEPLKAKSMVGNTDDLKDDDIESIKAGNVGIKNQVGKAGKLAVWNELRNYIKNKKELNPEPSKKEEKHKSHCSHIIGMKRKVGVDISIKNYKFYNQDDEIAAYIFGSDMRVKEPYVIGSGMKADGTQYGYDINKFFEDFDKNGPYKPVDKNNENKNSCLYKTTLIGELGNHNKVKDKKNIPICFDKRRIPRHFKVSTCRKWINYNSKEHTFDPSKLITFDKPYPAEEMVFSLFALVEISDENMDIKYHDIYHEVDFTQNDLDSLNMVHIIGVNVIVMIFKLNRHDKLELDRAWIDGEKVKIDEY